MPFSREKGLGIFDDWLFAGKPSGVYRPNVSRLDSGSDLAALTTQIMTSVALPVLAGDVITNLTFMSGATAAGTPTNWWFALYDASGNLLAQSADQTSTAWAADTAKTLALTAAQTFTADQVVFPSVMVKATTVPTLVGLTLGRAAFAGGVLTNDKPLARTSGSSLTTTAPATIATPTNVATIPYVVAT